jgi:hypothetical protein
MLIGPARGSTIEQVPRPGDSKAERAKWFEGLRRQRDLTSIVLREFHQARLDEIQAALPADTTLGA